MDSVLHLPNESSEGFWSNSWQNSNYKGILRDQIILINLIFILSIMSCHVLVIQCPLRERF